MLTQCEYHVLIWISSVQKQQRKSKIRSRLPEKRNHTIHWPLAVGVFALSDNSQSSQCNAVIKCITCYFHRGVSVTVRIKEKHIPYRKKFQHRLPES